MRAIRRTAPDPDGLLTGIEIDDRDQPPPPDGWVTVTLRCASVNHSDLAAIRGHGFDPAGSPRVLGSDGAGLDPDGNEVIVYPILAAARYPDPMHDPGLRMLSQGVDGTWAERVQVPRANLVPKPPELTWEQAACLGTAWLTAYRMLFGRARVSPGPSPANSSARSSCAATGEPRRAAPSAVRTVPESLLLPGGGARHLRLLNCHGLWTSRCGG
ncbi:hypothetical protein MXD59_02275 [Frankia sp. Ag45/Mut15]|uniref:Alcohol dehydrogenase-like N-terminal domain-containing protein n=1 Tax=Frankia umida TaxID=573489 RepID=A0ABT0JSW1_9ACTN|nr:hypothetical protein [Frankia umida]MCK9874619.1 hypothetical protein [Frankia umida]